MRRGIQQGVVHHHATACDDGHAPQYRRLPPHTALLPNFTTAKRQEDKRAHQPTQIIHGEWLHVAAACMACNQGIARPNHIGEEQTRNGGAHFGIHVVWLG